MEKALNRFTYPKSENYICVGCKQILHIVIYCNYGADLRRTFFKVDSEGFIVLPQQRVSLVKCPLCSAKQEVPYHSNLTEYLEVITTIMLHSLDQDGWHKDFVSCPSIEEFLKTEAVKTLLRERW